MRCAQVVQFWAWLAVLLALQPLQAAGTQAEDRQKIEIVPQIGHIDPVISVAFSPDGPRLLRAATTTAEAVGRRERRAAAHLRGTLGGLLGGVLTRRAAASGS